MKKKATPESSLMVDSRLTSAWERLHHFSHRYGKLKSSTGRTYLRLVFTHDQLMANFAKRLRAHGLTRAGLNVLTILRASEGQGCPHNKIGKLLLVSRANVTGLVNSLSRRGLIERGHDQNDRRICIARISKKGERLLEVLLPLHYEKIEKIFSGFSEADKEVLDLLMEKILVQIKGLKE